MPLARYPKTIDVTKQIARINNVLLNVALFLRRTIIPKPAFINKPARSAPNGKELEI